MNAIAEKETGYLKCDACGADDEWAFETWCEPQHLAIGMRCRCGERWLVSDVTIGDMLRAWQRFVRWYDERGEVAAPVFVTPELVRAVTGVWMVTGQQGRMYGIPVVVTRDIPTPVQVQVTDERRAL